VIKLSHRMVKRKRMSFLAQEAAARIKGSTIVALASIIDWSRLRKIMGKLDRTNYGPKGYEAIKMLKALILQNWYSLSDTELEEALRVRLDFMVITELSEVPDSTTICRFRNKLIQEKVMEKILKEINNELEQKGLKIKESKGAILDATIIASCSRPHKRLETIAVDREEEVVHEVINITTSCDPDAAWLKKGKKYNYGYKGFLVTDAEDGYIEAVHVTPANISEVTEFKEAIKKVECNGRRMYTDKGSASKENRYILRSKGFKNGIMEKAYKNNPLSYWQRCFNKLISKVRYKVEQCFGTLKRKFKFTRASYKSTVKVEAQMLMKSMAFNLLKAINKSAA